MGQSFPYTALLSLTTRWSIQSPRSRFRSKLSTSLRSPFSNLSTLSVFCIHASDSSYSSHNSITPVLQSSLLQHSITLTHYSSTPIFFTPTLQYSNPLLHYSSTPIFFTPILSPSRRLYKPSTSRRPSLLHYTCRHNTNCRGYSNNQQPISHLSPLPYFTDQ